MEGGESWQRACLNEQNRTEQCASDPKNTKDNQFILINSIFFVQSVFFKTLNLRSIWHVMGSLLLILFDSIWYIEPTWNQNRIWICNKSSIHETPENSKDCRHSTFSTVFARILHNFSWLCYQNVLVWISTSLFGWHGERKSRTLRYSLRIMWGTIGFYSDESVGV